MPNRFEWSEIAIVGFVGGTVGAILLMVHWLGASTDNLLNFFGGAVGSGTAVLATQWLNQRKRAKSLERLGISAVMIVATALRFEGSDDDIVPGIILTFDQSVDAFEAARLGTEITDAFQQHSLQSAIFWIVDTRKKLDGALADFQAGKITAARLTELATKFAQVPIGSIRTFVQMNGMPKLLRATLAIHEAKAAAGLYSLKVVKPTEV